MNYSVLKVITDTYMQYETTSSLDNCGERLKEYNKFHDKYVKPLLSENQKAGLELEDDFLCVTSAQEIKSFKDGFKSCIRLLLECASNKMAEA